MYYLAYSVQIKVGQVNAAIAHLKELVKHHHDVYGVTTEVMSPLSGSGYEIVLVSRLESIADLEKLNRARYSDAAFAHWFKASTEFFEWHKITQRSYEVL
jgi:hypothetical protein